MKVIIADSVRQVGSDDTIRKVSELFPKVISRALQPSVSATWEILGDVHGGKWVLLTLEYAGEAKDREVFEPSALANLEFMKERFEWLWGRVLRTRLIQQVNEPLEGEESVVQFQNG